MPLLLDRGDAREIMFHYDRLIDEGNDSFRDPAPLRVHMDKWDGEPFLSLLSLGGWERVLELGVGTGRLAARVAPRCGQLCGIDLSPRTVERARENLAAYDHISLVCGNFFDHPFTETYDLIYTSLTLFHISDKQAAWRRIADLLREGGRVVVSLDKSREPYIDMGDRRLRVFPDTPEAVRAAMVAVGLVQTEEIETEYAYLLAAVRPAQGDGMQKGEL